MKQFFSALIYCLFKPFGTLYAVVFQHLRFKKHGHKIPRGPVLVLSDHHSNWDGVYINMFFFFRIVHFIVHDELFRNKFTSFFFGTLLGEVRRGMTPTDVSDIMELRRLARKGKSIGITVEGDIHMFGRLMPVEESVAKLAKMLKLPVVLMQVEGAAGRAPRWARHTRHHPIIYHVNDVISLEELSSTSVKDLHARILAGITPPEKSSVHYKLRPSPWRAEWLELGFYYCPNCHQFETMKSKGDRVFCTKCDLEARYNRYEKLEQVERFGIQTLTDWEDVQDAALQAKVDALKPGELLFEAKDLDYYRTKQVGYFKKPELLHTTLRVYEDRLEGYDEKEQLFVSVPIRDMVRINLQYKDVLEVHFGEDRIRFRTKKRKWSGYLYVRALLKLKVRQKEKSDS